MLVILMILLDIIVQQQIEHRGIALSNLVVSGIPALSHALRIVKCANLATCNTVCELEGHYVNCNESNAET